MQEVIISDTSCLILFNKIGKLSLLQKLFREIIVTRIVAEEFNKELPNWIIVQNPIDIENQTVLSISLDRGEASSIALAMERKDCRLIIDEQKGRRIARQLGLTITGTLGVLAEAKQRGLILLLKPILDKIKQTDFRLSERLIQEILKQVEE